jgi:Cu(I)/Ag(I) efflux system membrane fusion protein
MNISRFIILLIFISSLNGQIIDVKQLFNKKVTTVKEERVHETKSYYGETLFSEDSIKDVVLRFDGYVTKLDANKNFMEVKRGDKLFSLYSDKIESIKKEIEITKSINKSLYKSSLKKLNSLDVNLNQIKNKDVTFYAPFDGIVLNKKINDGSYVKNGTLIMQIANINKIWFISKVYQSDLPFLSKDMDAKINIDGINMSFKTKIDYIYPIANNQSKTIDVRFVIDNKNRKLFPNMFGKAIIKSSSKKVLTLPKTALLTKGNKHYVFKPISKDEFEPILVEARRINASKYEIEEGLSAGDEVLDNALFLLDSDAITNSLYDSEDNDW